MSGIFLSCSKGVKDPLEVREFRCDLPGEASLETGLISPGGENLLDFLELRPLGIPLPSMLGPNLVWSHCRNLRFPLQC